MKPRIAKLCQQCSAPFSVPVSLASKKFCDNECWFRWHAAKARNCAHCGDEFIGPARKKFCQRACLAKATNQQRAVPCPGCGKVMMRRPSDDSIYCNPCGKKASGMKRRGRVMPHLKDSVAHAHWLQAMQSAEHRDLKRQQMTGFVHTKDSARRNSPSHACALDFFVRTPRGVVHHVRNLSAFVRQHPDLFDPTDLVNKSKQRASFLCNATTGLRSIHKGRRGTWKGWTLVGWREGREAVYDLLGRLNIEPTRKP